MDITYTQVVYAIVFIAVLFSIEGIYLLILGSSYREYIVNRRMKAAHNTDARFLNPSIIKKEIVGGPISNALLSIAPGLLDLYWTANLKITPATACSICLMLAAGTFTFTQILLGIPAPLALLVAVVIGIGIPWLFLQACVDRQRKKFAEQLPDAINLIARGLQAGHPVPVAFGLVAREMADPIGSEFGIIVDEINFGRERDDAMRNTASRYPNPDFKFFLAAIEMQRETGGNLVSVLDNLATIIRERANMRKKAWAMSAEGRLTCLIVAILPYLLMTFLLITNPRFVLDVVDHPHFWTLMGGAWALWLIGIIWIWRMVNIKV